MDCLPWLISSDGYPCQIKWSISLPNLLENLTVASIASKKEPVTRPNNWPTAPKDFVCVIQWSAAPVLGGSEDKLYTLVFFRKFWVQVLVPPFQLHHIGAATVLHPLEEPHWHKPVNFATKSAVEIAYCGVVQMVVMVMAYTDSVDVWQLIHSARNRAVPFCCCDPGGSTEVIEYRICENV